MTNQTISSQKKSTQLTKSQAVVEQFLSFYLDADQQSLLPTQQLLEIVKVSLTQITAIAGLAPSIMGIYNWRGDVIWVVDLASLLGYKPLYAQQYEQEKLQDKCHIILLRSQDNVIGLAVQHVGQIVKCDISKIQTSALTFANPAMMQACRGYWLSGSEETFLVLDGDAIAEIVST
ncbi:chemotaxis protein CheW [Pseudanabaena sp. BC1403]|uniref:chemotaxis protein CheW n=1 Tax=Pseudanabaena sp. BC1403 TaxID=2043171 RepID=UPI000CD84AF6|nr:chemotaxis protein CheW [Pseudanabaena sp. BC1403]